MRNWKMNLATSLMPLWLLSSGAGADTPSASPLIGRWILDLSRLQMPAPERPRSVTIEFAVLTDGRWHTTVSVVAADGRLSTADGAAALDGLPAHVTGELEADTAAGRMPAPDVLVMLLARGRTPASTRIYTVSPDGAEMIETVTYFDRDGTPIMRTNYFSRAVPGS